MYLHIQKRLEHGVAEELLPLFRIGPDLVHAHRARALFDAGLKTHEDLAAVRVVMMGVGLSACVGVAPSG